MIWQDRVHWLNEGLYKSLKLILFHVKKQRIAENEGVTEDDVNEIKNDISAFRLWTCEVDISVLFSNEWASDVDLWFRFELIEIMRASGMKTDGATGPSGAIHIIKGVKSKLEDKKKRVLKLNNDDWKQRPQKWKTTSGPGGKKNRQKERRLMKGFLAAGGKLPPESKVPGPPIANCPQPNQPIATRQFPPTAASNQPLATFPATNLPPIQ